MANNLSIDDIATVANAVLANAQGGTATANTSDFVTIAQLALKTGYDPLSTAISQVLSRTIFSYRPYTRKFSGLEKDAIRWGNHVRKLSPIDKDLEQDNRFVDGSGNVYSDGSTIDQYKVSKPEVLQTNFYGSQTYQKSLTVWKDQLDSAFEGPEQFGNFLTMIMGNATDQLEQTREDLARGVIQNLIGQTILTGNEIHLVTEYNTLTGLSLTASTVMQPANFRPFMQFVFARIQSLIELLSERSYKFHLNPYQGGTQKLIRRHTPKDRLHVYMLSDFVNKADAMALADTFHDGYLKQVDFERVSFWQSINSPMAITTTANILTAGSASADSALGTSNVAETAIVGILFDDDAAGINLVEQYPLVTPMNARGAYQNYFWHEQARWYNDATENAIVLTLD